MKKITNYWNLLKNDSTTRKSFLWSWLFIYVGTLLVVYFVDKGLNNVTYFTFIVPIFTSLAVHLGWEIIFHNRVYTESATEAKELWNSNKSFFFNNVNGDLNEDFLK